MAHTFAMLIILAAKVDAREPFVARGRIGLQIINSPEGV